ncbi:MAG TPA: group 1 truncated hemoglobin [Candidatus Binataceae bacterium]|nr:group 1 truncated hemoglobin [Candidatus Binataceae bacterium]
MSNGTQAGGTLYGRLGGYDAIAAIVDEFLQSLASVPQMERYGSSMNLDSRRRNRQLTLDFICAATGGPAFYLGKDMKTSHAGLGISASDWQLAMDHVGRALAKFKVGTRESNELIALIDGLAAEIVER